MSGNKVKGRLTTGSHAGGRVMKAAAKKRSTLVTDASKLLSKTSSPHGKSPKASTGASALATTPTKGQGKRKREDAEDESHTEDGETPRPAKKSKAAAPKAEKRPSRVDAAPAVINKVPSKVLTVLIFGAGECGELGLGPKRKAALNPRVNPFLNPNDAGTFHAVQVACGGMHTLALTADNKIVSWGVNDNDALGRDTRWEGGMRDADESEDEDDEDLNPHESTPTNIPTSYFPEGTTFVQVAAGDSCSFALTATGLVYGWGTFLDSQGRARFRLDENKELIEKQEQPILVPGLSRITQIACGANHALALDASGTVWGWGNCEQNQLGRPHAGALEDTLTPRKVEIGRRGIKYIASGEYHSFAVDDKDRVWGWGLNSFGEAGYAKTAGGDAAVLPEPKRVRELSRKGIRVIDGGAHHSAAVTADGECLVWGRLDGGQLGIKFSQEQLDDETQIRRDEYNKPRICLKPTAVPNIGKVAHVACGTDHTIIINDQGHGYATGFGSSGQLGLGDEDDRDVARKMGGKNVVERELLWAGAGGQFSVVAATVKIE
ncbi:Guanine nucleotide exchange factor SRM1 [Cladobotryum mycophilum]|uniref:Guanine nucleotide exchange factor SRM1 n=1 Tax=Cladobotryum mycophilum TaxID=491253 RepID=A0ABR0S7X6_9HYPO